MVIVRALFRDHVDRCAFGTPVFGGEALRTDLKLLDRFEGQLHHGSAHCVVLVVDAVHRDVDIAAVFAVDGENRVAVFRGIVGVCSLDARSEIREIGNIASDHRQFFDLFGSNVLAHAGLRRVHDWSGVSYLNDGSDRAWFQRGIRQGRLTDEQLDRNHNRGEALL